MRKYYLMLSEEDIMCSAYLMAAMSMLYSMLMNFDKSDYWYDKLAEYRDNAKGSEKREATQRIVYLEISLPHRGNINILELIKGCYALLTDKSIPFPELSVTSNQPSLMNGGKDFCDWSRHDREIAAAAGKPVVTFLGKYRKGLVNAALAESFFEKGGDRCAADRNIDKKWFERVRTETGKMARRYPLYLKNTVKNIPELRPMDIRILTCLADGLSVQKTAEKLNINYETLRSRIKEIYRRPDAKNKTEAVMVAREMKLI
ncbi:MAG: LuxR C-terminal-related transcriptional regulator [Oscillospiraceae bacterium]|nr:LuxR C-terminal-related transcriptional regulator [Oscillospiraceae bacterium]